MFLRSRRSGYGFFFGAESGSHPGVEETSNSGASELAAAAAALAFGFGVTAVFAAPDFEATAGFGVVFAAAGASVALAVTGAGSVAAAAFGAGFAATGFAPAAGFDTGSGALPRPNALSTEARRSTSMRNGCPEEYSAWNITFHDWQIMRSRTIGSCAENWALRQSIVSTPFSSSSISPSKM